MEKTTYSTYETPRLEVIDVKIEKGFTATTGPENGTEDLEEMPW